jgi:hypothetical protein
VSDSRLFRSHRNAVLAALLVGFIVLLPACGGSSSDSKASGTDTEAGADGAADGSAPDAGVDGKPSADGCQELAARWQNLVAGPASAVGGGTGDAETLRAQIDALSNEIPEQISAAFAVFASGTEKVLELMNSSEDPVPAAGEDPAGGGAVADPAPADVDTRLQAVADVTTSAEFTEALAQIEAYFAASCPSA